MRMMTTLLLGLAASAAAAAGVLALMSPGRPDPPRDATGRALAGGFSERAFVTVNGARQGMFIQGTGPDNPVLLFLHGGPGMPEFVFTETYPTPLARHVTVVWWDQRGAGLSYGSGIPSGSMTMEQMITDAVAIADHLRARFGQDRIYLMGHSWGSFLGIRVAAAAPDRFHAYIGMAQVAHQLRSEEMAHAAMTEAYRKRGDTAMVRRLAAAPVSVEGGMSKGYMRLRDGAMHRLGAGTTRDMRSVVTGVFLPVWRSRAYTLGEKIGIWRGLAFSRAHLWEEFLRTDLAGLVTTVDIPVYILAGRHDLTANPALARSFFDGLDAPLKGFYTFEASAHSPLFEEPDRAVDILVHDVLRRRTDLADR